MVTSDNLTGLYVCNAYNYISTESLILHGLGVLLATENFNLYYVILTNWSIVMQEWLMMFQIEHTNLIYIIYIYFWLENGILVLLKQKCWTFPTAFETLQGANTIMLTNSCI